MKIGGKQVSSTNSESYKLLPESCIYSYKKVFQSIYITKNMENKWQTIHGLDIHMHLSDSLPSQFRIASCSIRPSRASHL